jgi:hypothetical protein
MHRPTTFRWIERWIGWRLGATAGLAATLAALAFDETPRLVLYMAMTWLVIACTLRPDDQLLRPALANPFVKHVIFVLALALSIAAATLSYRFFEAPILRWKDRIAKRPGELPGALADVRAPL